MLKDMVFSRWLAEGCEDRSDTMKMVGLAAWEASCFEDGGLGAWVASCLVEVLHWVLGHAGLDARSGANNNNTSQLQQGSGPQLPALLAPNSPLF